MLYKLLIVDDEQIVLDSTKYIIEKYFPDVIVAGTFSSGREAIEKAEILVPDIIFMDIKMPGINGIDAIREIRTRLKNVHFVILTAYDKFEFAKEAVQLGVDEYLLKPITKETIIDTMKKMIEKIKVEKEMRKRDLDLKEKLEMIYPILESGFIYSVLFFEDCSKELESYKNIFEIGENAGFIMTIEFGEPDGIDQIGNKIGFSVRSQSFYPYFRDLIKSVGRSLVGPVMLNRIIVFIPAELNGDEYNQRIEAIDIAEYIYNKLTEKVEADFYIGIGRHEKLENLTRSYEDSLKAIRFSKTKGVMHIMDALGDSGMNIQYPVSKEKLLLEKALLGETAECLRLFNYLFDWLSTEYDCDSQKVKNRLIELVVLLHRMGGFDDDAETNLVNEQDYLNEFQTICDLSELKIWCRNRIETITCHRIAIREKKISGMVIKAREYIGKNFKKEITLEDVSREVGISHNYFCKLFKEQTGENFIDYLTALRIQKAKDMLKEGVFSVKEICYDVGYGDPNYFSRIFKKIVGVTPTEYKESLMLGGSV